jgi:hypothetical protein
MSPLVGSRPTEKSERKRTDTRSVGPIPRGTDGSNPVPSSGESVANRFLPRGEPNGKPHSTDQFEGGCLCGEIRFVATGQPKGVYWCHCQSCRRHSGAPVSVFVAFEHAAFTGTKGEKTKFDSSPGRTRRGFCAKCGSTLTCESARLDRANAADRG